MSRRRSPSEAPRRVARLAGCIALTSGLMLCGTGPAQASLGVFHTDVGTLKLSVDATGTIGSSSTVQVEKPAGASVRKAFLFAASTGFTGYSPHDGSVSLDGTPITWDPAWTRTSGIQSVNVAADVTALVKSKVDAAAAGRVDFQVQETPSGEIDGETLAVILTDPAAKVGTVTLMYGAQSPGGDTFSLGLAEPLKPSAAAQLGLGISFGHQPSVQFSQIDVNGARLTTSAGGEDDGQSTNGALITAGGLDDDPANPADPLADGSCGPRCDDELYDLKPFVPTGSTSIDVATLNPSADDNIFLAAFDIDGVNTVGDGIVLSPDSARTQVDNFFFFDAVARNAGGDPVGGKTVTLTTISGPNAGSVQQATTNARGRANFNYASRVTGTDVLRATFVDDGGVTRTSNDLTKTWIARVNDTFGGTWPYTSGPLRLYYSYGGGHRYLGNIVQAVRNWNDAHDKLEIAEWPGAPAAIHMPVLDVHADDDWAGYTLFADNECSNCGYTRASILLNQDFLDGQNDARRTKTSTHEMGHALGLTHPTAASSTPSVMWGGPVGGSVRTSPQPYDVTRVKGLYP